MNDDEIEEKEEKEESLEIIDLRFRLKIFEQQLLEQERNQYQLLITKSRFIVDSDNFSQKDIINNRIPLFINNCSDEEESISPNENIQNFETRQRILERQFLLFYLEHKKNFKKIIVSLLIMLCFFAINYYFLFERVFYKNKIRYFSSHEWLYYRFNSQQDGSCYIY